MRQIRIDADGSGWNGRECKYKVAFEDGRVITKKFSEKKTVPELEYAAVIRALKLAKEGDEVYTDSQLVVGQVMEGYKIHKDHLFPLAMKARQLVREKDIPVIWNSRDDNRAGHLLETKKSKKR